jgi:hypothetical protein
VPYKEIERQRRARRESAARARARARDGSAGTSVEPDAPARRPPSPGDLYRLGLLLNCPQMPREEYSAYHQRLRAHWQHIRALLE